MALRITEQRSLHTTGTELNTCGTLVFSILAVIGEQPPESGMGEVCFEICTGLAKREVRPCGDVHREGFGNTLSLWSSCCIWKFTRELSGWTDFKQQEPR